MQYERYACIIVDAFSTGKKLALDIRSKGYNCIHIQSSPDLPADRFSHQKADFVKSLVYNGNIDSLLSELKKDTTQIRVCIPGSESGVELADLISEKLGLPTNGTACSHARRNKYAMIETVGKAGIKTVKHFKSKDPQAIIEWIKREVSQYPVVLKPLESANGDGVFFCNNENEVRDAHKKILDTANLFGQKNEEVLAESFNYGQEYVVNTASCEAEDKTVKHFVAEIWRAHRKPGTTIYDKAEIVHPDEKEYSILANYTFSILNALQIKIGAATTELKYTVDGGPVLIETAARIMGGAPLSLSNELFGHTQLSLATMAYLNPHTFLSFISLQRTEKKRHGMDVMLISDAEGEIINSIDTTKIEQLETLHSYVINGNKGAKLQKTIDSTTSPGEIFLRSDEPAKLRADYSKIRQLEAGGLYQHAISKEPLSTLYEKFGLLGTQSDIPPVVVDVLPTTKANAAELQPTSGM